MPWYEIAEESTPITQGYIIMNCPVAAWSEAPLTLLIRMRSHIEDVRQGIIWNLSMLNAYDGDILKMDIRIVDFHEVFSLPGTFLENWLSYQGVRLRLLPPYREHLSQAFARFFMRVGLPIDIPRFR